MRGLGRRVLRRGLRFEVDVSLSIVFVDLVLGLGMLGSLSVVMIWCLESSALLYVEDLYVQHWEFDS